MDVLGAGARRKGIRHEKTSKSHTRTLNWACEGIERPDDAVLSALHRDIRVSEDRTTALTSSRLGVRCANPV